ncbi:GNAT family N-acetyltransferase [Nanoarchaeota archaeon]
MVKGLVIRRLNPKSEKDLKGAANVISQSYNISSLKEGLLAVNCETQRKGFIYIIAEKDGKIAGLTTWRMHGLPKHELAELDRIVVLDEYRRQGIGTKLFNALVKDVKKSFKKHGKKLRKLFLLSHEDNEDAHIMYRKLGLVAETILRDHYYKNRPETVFSKFF